jgi:hypothetical protein
MIDLAIDKKLNSGRIVEFAKDQLFQFTKYSAKPAGILEQIASLRSIRTNKDNFGNMKYDFLSVSSTKSLRKFNLIKMFKPGEILDTLINT